MMSCKGLCDVYDETKCYIDLTTSIIRCKRACIWEIIEFGSHVGIFEHVPPQSEEFSSNYDYDTKFKLRVVYYSKLGKYYVKLKIKPSDSLQKLLVKTFIESEGPNGVKSRSSWTKNLEKTEIDALEIEASWINSRDSTDSLILRCIIYEYYITNEKNPDFYGCTRKLSNDFEKLLEEKSLPDFTFNVGNESLQVHKCILAARSPVFYAMFHHDLSENNKNVADVPDIDPIAFKEMLRFIYTGCVQNMKTVVFDLLKAADKYQIEELKTQCEKSFCNFSVSEAPIVLLLADTHNAKILKEKTLKFIKQHIKEAIGTEEFLQLYARKDLIQEVMETVVNK